jgi:hypothetical protein
MTTGKIALVTLAMSLLTGACGATRPNDPPAITNMLLSCQSLDVYKRFADFDLSRNGAFLPWADHEMPQALKDIFSTCMWLDDNARLAKPNVFHVEKTDQGYSCVRKVYTEQCYWTTASKLQYIGHGPQLTDEQFAEVLRLDVAGDAAFEMAKEYGKRRDERGRAIMNNGHYPSSAADTAKIRALVRERDELQDLYSKTMDQVRELHRKAAFGIVPSSHGEHQ